MDVSSFKAWLRRAEQARLLAEKRRRWAARAWARAESLREDIARRQESLHQLRDNRPRLDPGQGQGGRPRLADRTDAAHSPPRQAPPSEIPARSATLSPDMLRAIQ